VSQPGRDRHHPHKFTPLAPGGIESQRRLGPGGRGALTRWAQRTLSPGRRGALTHRAQGRLSTGQGGAPPTGPRGDPPGTAGRGALTPRTQRGLHQGRSASGHRGHWGRSGEGRSPSGPRGQRSKASLGGAHPRGPCTPRTGGRGALTRSHRSSPFPPTAQDKKPAGPPLQRRELPPTGGP